MKKNFKLIKSMIISVINIINFIAIELCFLCLHFFVEFKKDISLGCLPRKVCILNLMKKNLKSLKKKI